jgi:hypothetical protein
LQEDLRRTRQALVQLRAELAAIREEVAATKNQALANRDARDGQRAASRLRQENQNLERALREIRDKVDAILQEKERK